jgi:lipopolysaccharide/colanic/teichoic acid biosynthesis glycosyltransferase
MKRLADLLIASTALILLLPVMLLTAAMVRVGLGAPVLYRQIRPGRFAAPFLLYKFRTMTDAVDACGDPLPDRERLTPLGSFLRRTSLDELPELFNVLKGEMSLVGPRPLYVKYLPYYTERERLRHSVRPGITGWAQVHGRNLVPWSDRLAMDVWYVEHQSLLLDLKILGLTFLKVFTREGVAAIPDDVEMDLDQERGGKSHPGWVELRDSGVLSVPCRGGER